MQINISSSTKAIPIKKKKKLGIFKFILSFFLGFLGYFIIFGGIQKIFPHDFVKPYKQYSISFDNGIPTETEDKIKADLGSVGFDEKKRFAFVEKDADFNVSWREGKGIITQYYVPIAHLYSVEDNFLPTKQKIYTDINYPENVIAILRSKYPTINTIANYSSLLDKNTKSVALVNFDSLTYKNKLLYLNGKYFLDDTSGSIEIGLGITPNNAFVQDIIDRNISNDIASISFDKSKLGTINQTGVTALTRNLATKIDRSGDMGYAAQLISKFLKSADITHVSNEISSVPGCKPSQGMRFCARPEYLKTLTDSGVDIVELTGNHNNDYGAIYNANTLKSYTKMGIKYFGGGLNTADSKKILYLDIKGTKVAFLGYNYYDTMQGTAEIAGADRAGSNKYSPAKIKADIATAKKSASVIIVDIQFQECYSYPTSSAAYLPCYKPLANPDQQEVFRMAVDYGADIVVGTQAHQPQTYEIYNGKLIFYGLGNLFFDQTPWVGTRQGIILTHYLYNGKLIQTKLTTTYYQDDMRTYVTTGSARTYLLTLLKNAR
ncbi:CapA family protein [Candidatus Dojkabacteria bacterium]|jgi:poly-gamma-glutamate capsule biosynthesis protein CapA/YwtB (metallophosphatase superfamily)|nr:CapA family protein [Candidatus Dojkabacteria bacterium]